VSRRAEGGSRRGSPVTLAKLEGFPWVAGASPRVLVLGSMPSAASLGAGEYYAHPRNAFWPIMGELFGAGRDRPYAERLAVLAAAGVVLWDVVRRCHRPGSLDAAIDRESVEPNDFAALYRACPRVHTVFFNGHAAQALYRRLVAPTDPAPGRTLACHLLPSTSPAHAALDFAAKLARWRAVAVAARADAPQRSM